MVSVGWMILNFVLFSGPTRAEPVITLSPIFAAVNLCENVVLAHRDLRWTLSVTTLWLVAVAGAAALLLALTYATFDRCLGRMPDWDDEFRLGPRPPWLEP